MTSMKPRPPRSVFRAVLAGALLATLAFVFVPRRFAAVLPAAMVGFFLLTSYAVHGAIRDFSRSIRQASGLAGDERWIDDRVHGAGVTYLFGLTADPRQEETILWENEFWNRRLDAVYTVGVPEPIPLPETALAIDRATGRLVSAATRPRAGYVVTAAGVDLAGTRLASRPPLALYRTASPLRVDDLVDGVYADGWIGNDASYSVFGPRSARGRTVDVLVSRRVWRGPDVPARVTVELTSLAPSRRARSERHWTIHSGKERLFRLRAPAPPFRVRVHVSRTFTPAQFGLGDTRALGAQVTFALGPRARARPSG
jgi:hypothetical protein